MGVREARKAKGWSQQKLAHESVLRQATISALETGQQEPGKETMWAVAGALGTKPWEVFPDHFPAPKDRARLATVTDLRSRRKVRRLLASLEPRIGAMAREEHRKGYATGISVEDLEQEGRWAVVEAESTFDPSKGASLETWARLRAAGRIKDVGERERRRHHAVSLEDVLRSEGA